MNTVIQSIQGMGSLRTLILGAVGIVIITIFGFLSIRLSSPVLSPLYTKLSSNDLGIVVTELGSMGVSFDIDSGNNQIMVKSSDVLRVRMALAQKGLPSKGSIVGYEIFDKEAALGTSNFVLNVNLLRALEGELGRTIASLSSVTSARVHLVMPKRDIFRKNKIEPSASVVLTLNNRTDVPKDETMAVKHLVSSAVPGLNPARVTVVDSEGKVLARGVGDKNEDGMVGSSNAGEYRINYESKLKRTIESILEQAVGAGRVEAQVSAEISFDRLTTSSETFDPAGQVPRSVQTSEESSTSNDKTSDALGVGANLPDVASSTKSSGSTSSSEKVDEVTNFEISKTVSNKVSEVGTVKRITVAVLVDGKYEAKQNANGEIEEVYVARTDEELDKFRSIVETAIGYDANRGDQIEIVNMQFSNNLDAIVTDEGAFDWLKRDLDSILKTLVVGVVAILAIMLVIRPLVNRAFEISPSDLEDDVYDDNFGDDQALAAGEGAGGDEVGIQDIPGDNSYKRINDIIENNPEETLSVIRTWLSQKT